MRPKVQFSKFISELNAKDHIAVFYDSDSDGICSATITIKSLEKLGHKVERYIPCSHSNFNPARLKGLKDEGINKIIFLDFSADQYSDFTENTSLFDAILVIDHHKIYKDLNSDKIIFIKAQYLRKDLDGSDYCTSKMAFDLFSEVTDVSEFDWLAAIGTLTDLTDDKWQTFLNKVYKRYKTSKKELINAGCIIDAGKQIEPPQVERALDVVLEAKKYQDILKSDFSKLYNELKNEIEFWINKFEEKADHKKDTWIYEIDPSGRIGSTVSTLVAIAHPDDTILITRRQNGWVSINARNHTSMRAVNDLLEKAVKGLKGANAGGHRPAAGGTVREKDYEEFKKRIWKLA